MARSFLSRPTRYWLRFDLQTWRQRVGARRESPTKRGARYLNVGSGDQGIDSPEWLNIDGWKLPGVDLVWTFRETLPFESGRFEAVYSEHFLEHLDDNAGRLFLAECHRVLKPGGVLRVSVPDGALYLDKYWNDREWMLNRRNAKFSTPMEVVNECFRQGFEHQFIYDFETLSLRLHDAGFTDVQRCDFGTGRLEALLIDQERRRFESLYVEAARP